MSASDRMVARFENPALLRALIGAADSIRRSHPALPRDEKIAAMAGAMYCHDRPSESEASVRDLEYFVRIAEPLLDAMDWTDRAAEEAMRAGTRSTPTALFRPPCMRLGAIARWLWSKKTCELVFDPLRADLAHEWCEAEVAGRRWQARWIKYVRGPWAMLFHMLALAPASILKGLFTIVKAIF